MLYELKLRGFDAYQFSNRNLTISSLKAVKSRENHERENLHIVSLM